VKRRPTVFTVVGARPQFVKAAPLSRALRPPPREVPGPHRPALRPGDVGAFFDELGSPPPISTSGSGPGARRHDGPHAGRAGDGDARRTARPRPRHGGHELHPRRAPWPRPSSGSPSPTWRRACAASTRRMPEEINRRLTDHVSTLPLLSDDGRGREPPARGHHPRRPARGRRHEGRDRPEPRPRAPPAPLPGVPRAAGYYLATAAPAGERRRPRRLGAILSALERLSHPVFWPVHPRARRQMDGVGTAAAGRGAP
jgi:UDP-GlcNAc3NAcA epimerase